MSVERGRTLTVCLPEYVKSTQTDRRYLIGLRVADRRIPATGKIPYSAAFAFSAMAANASLSLTAISASIFRFRSIPATFSPCIRVE